MDLYIKTTNETHILSVSGRLFRNGFRRCVEASWTERYVRTKIGLPKILILSCLDKVNLTSDALNRRRRKEKKRQDRCKRSEFSTLNVRVREIVSKVKRCVVKSIRFVEQRPIVDNG